MATDSAMVTETPTHVNVSGFFGETTIALLPALLSLLVLLMGFGLILLRRTAESAR